MKLQLQIQQDFTNLVKEKNNLTKELLKVVLAEFSRYSLKDVPDEEVLRIIKKMRDSAIECGNLNEVPILEKYLPKMMTENELREYIKSIISENNFSGMKDMSKVMVSIRKSEFSSIIDNGIAIKIVKDLLK